MAFGRVFLGLVLGLRPVWARRWIHGHHSSGVTSVGPLTSGSGGSGELRRFMQDLKALGARVVDGEVALGHAHQRFGSDGSLDTEVTDQLGEILDELAAEARTTSAPVDA